MSKEITNVRRDEYRNAPVGPVGDELCIRTSDDWSYVFRRLTQQEPFELIHKRRPDGSKSTDKHVPKPVIEYFEETPNIELVNAKVMKR